MLVFKRERRALAAVLGLACLFAASVSRAQARPTAEWTVLVFMNGDNDLEKYAIADYIEMAKAGSTEDVQVVVQLDRRTTKSIQGVSGWTETIRFRVEKGKRPQQRFALKRMGELDMGDGKVLQDFVEWGIQEFPARKYALVIWDHGDGFRNIPGTGGARRERYFRSVDEATFRAVSHDQTNQNVLFTRELQDSLSRALKGRRLDILGFDACLMGMVEVAYALRNVADVLVASEELVPGNGWGHDLWLKELVRDPFAYDGERLGSLIVRSYEKVYGNVSLFRDPGTTLSAIRLVGIDPLAEAITGLSRLLMDELDRNLEAIRRARASCSSYGLLQTCRGRICYHNVDLGRFVERLAAETSDISVATAARQVSTLLDEARVDNWASAARRSSWGSTGLAIYFPPTRASYEADVTRKQAYEKDNQYQPVQFVKDHEWADFLHLWFANVP